MVTSSRRCRQQRSALSLIPVVQNRPPSSASRHLLSFTGMMIGMVPFKRLFRRTYIVDFMAKVDVDYPASEHNVLGRVSWVDIFW